MTTKAIINGRVLDGNGGEPMDGVDVIVHDEQIQAVGKAEEVGTLEDGKRADLLIADGDPLSDIEMLEDQDRIALVMSAGRVYAGSEKLRQHVEIRPSGPSRRSQ